MLDTIIVGGGLCGLAVGAKLAASGREFVLLEARDRLGGRILTRRCETARMPVDLGATWYWPDIHPRVSGLLGQLGLESFAQSDSGRVLSMTDPNARPEALQVDGVHGGAQRVRGGTSMIINALAARQPEHNILLGHRLLAVSDLGYGVAVDVMRGGERVRFEAHHVVLAIPPRLLAEHVVFEPGFPPALLAAMESTPTWMAGHAKVVFGFDQAFWLAAGMSGNAFANLPEAVLGEIFDACEPGSGTGAPRHAALGGFVALPHTLREAFSNGLPMLIRSQLVQFFGAEAQRGERHYQDWAAETCTCSTRDRLPTQDTPVYGDPLLSAAHWNGRLMLGATETATYGGGYMEGALEAAGRICQQLLAESAMSA
jgi:monoamine oxidase